MSSSPKYPAGIDCVWLAVDRFGQVGAFVTRGEGPIPNSAHPGAVANPSLEEALVSLPKAAAARQLVEYKDPSTFVAMAERGVYTFDWSDVHRTNAESTGRYQLGCAPSVSLLAEAPPLNLRVIAEATRIDGQAFHECEKLGIAV